MVKKAVRAIKAARPQKASRWTVRGVSAKLQKSAGDAARARNQTLGQWLSQLVAAATEGGAAAMTEGWAELVERRLARLERELLDTDAAAAASERPAASPASPLPS